MSNEKKQISVKKVLSLLEEGYTRTPDKKGYLGDGKSISEYYGLTPLQVAQVFKHDKLKNKKTRKPKPEPTFVVVDDTNEVPTMEPQVPEAELRTADPVVQTSNNLWENPQS